MPAVPDKVKLSFVIFDIRALWRPDLSVRVPGYQKLQTTAGLTRSGTGCFTAVPTLQQWASKGWAERSISYRVRWLDSDDCLESTTPSLGYTWTPNECSCLATADHSNLSLLKHT